MDGSEVTQQIRRREGSGRRTPVVAVTALALAHERERCLAAGMDDYLTKPVTFDSLQRVLKQWLGEGIGGARTAAADGALLDSELWHQYRQAGTFDPDFIPRLVDLFVAHTRAQLAELRQAVAADDRSEIARLAHAMKGACNQVGAQRMAELLGSLVTSAREARGDVLSPLVEQLAEEQQRVSMELSAVKQNGVRAV
jgi:HPt (histidine-containing phosphotransfer) domain-containing protein